MTENKMNDDALEKMAREIVEKVMPNIHVEDWDDSVGGAIRSWPGKEMQEVIEFEFEEAITEALYTLRSKTRKEYAEIMKKLIDNCKASCAESGISDARKEYRKGLFSRSQAILKKDECEQ